MYETTHDIQWIPAGWLQISASNATTTVYSYTKTLAGERPSSGCEPNERIYTTIDAIETMLQTLKG
jgi:hypothetical protein